ncbi:MAG: copper-binding protein [Candidatus Nitrosothermus koennekii]|nr:MAG: copper-binding protein [Candidatus Nitrosothermus koennekii]
MAGVGLALAGVARTFLEGMHAISGLVMFVGMIFLAAGLLKGGLPTTPRAKAAAAIILGLMIAFGAFAASVSTVPSLPLFIGVLLIIIAPSIVIAFAMSRNSKYTKAISILFISTSAVGMIAFLAFNAATQPTIAEEEEEGVTIPEGPRVEITIPEGASIQGNIPYLPQEITVKQGVLLVWINNDTIAHTVTSGSGFDDPDFGKLFDSSLINPGEEFVLNTNELDLGTYAYFCTLHPFMVGQFTIEEAVVSEATIPEGSITVEIVNGAGQRDHPEFYKPDLVTINVGDTVTWINNDIVPHTVTGAIDAQDPNTWGSVTIAGEKFDSGVFLPDERWSFTFNEKGEYEYVCTLHPWMTGEVRVE